jgi:photosystem II stability/assembly factor-like uncharacterized protein
MCWKRISVAAIIVGCLVPVVMVGRGDTAGMAPQVAIEVLPPVPSKNVHAIVDGGDGRRAYMATTEGLFTSSDGGRSWVEVGMGPATALTGRKQVFGIGVHPGDPRILLVGNWEGLWKTYDGGATWIRVGTQLPRDLVALSVSFNRSSPDVVYIATNGYGVFRSLDGGFTWTGGDQGLPREADGRRAVTVHTVAADPADPNVAYAGTSLDGLFKTVDGGRTWKGINEGLPVPLSWRTYPPRITVSPVNPAILYFALGIPYHSHLVATEVYVSTNGGGTWRPLVVPLEMNLSIDQLTFAPGDPNTLHLRAGEKLFKVPVSGVTETGKAKP